MSPIYRPCDMKKSLGSKKFFLAFFQIFFKMTSKMAKIAHFFKNRSQKPSCTKFCNDLRQREVLLNQYLIFQDFIKKKLSVANHYNLPKLEQMNWCFSGQITFSPVLLSQCSHQSLLYCHKYIVHHVPCDRCCRVSPSSHYIMLHVPDIHYEKCIYIVLT